MFRGFGSFCVDGLVYFENNGRSTDRFRSGSVSKQLRPLPRGGRHRRQGSRSDQREKTGQVARFGPKTRQKDQERRSFHAVFWKEAKNRRDQSDSRSRTEPEVKISSLSGSFEAESFLSVFLCNSPVSVARVFLPRNDTEIHRTKEIASCPTSVESSFNRRIRSSGSFGFLLICG